MGSLKVRNPITGTWEYAGIPGPPGVPGADGPMGPQGDPGPTGVSSVIVGDFGNITTPADLPPSGAIPVDWDGPGNPAAALQMELGWSLYYDKPGDPLDGHLFQYVGTGIDPSGWLDIGLIQGPPGPTGPQGVQGDIGPPGPPLPNAGNAGAPLTKATAVDQDVQWGGDVIMGAGTKIAFQGVAAPTVLRQIAPDVLSISQEGRGDGLLIHPYTVTATVDLNVEGSFGPGVTYNVVWQNGFTGSCTIRVNPASVTVAMWQVACNVAIAGDKQVYMFDWPAGVPDPPQELRTPVEFRNAAWAATNIGGLILANAGGCNLHTFNQTFNGNDHMIDVSFTWTR